MASSPGALLRTAMASMTVKEKDDGSDDDDNGSDLGAEQESFFSTSADRIRGNLATIITEFPPGVCWSHPPTHPSSVPPIPSSMPRPFLDAAQTHHTAVFSFVRR
jgi:hypothetical protein